MDLLKDPHEEKPLKLKVQNGSMLAVLNFRIWRVNCMNASPINLPKTKHHLASARSNRLFGTVKGLWVGLCVKVRNETCQRKTVLLKRYPFINLREILMIRFGSKFELSPAHSESEFLSQSSRTHCVPIIFDSSNSLRPHSVQLSQLVP